MGCVVKFSELAAASSQGGVAVAPITKGDTKEFAAEHVRIDAGKSWKGTAPAVSDCYIFSIKGGGAIAAGTAKAALPEQTFATIQEGTAFEVTNTGRVPLQLLKVITPVASGSRHPGFKGGIEVTERSNVEVVDVPEQHKKRIYFCGHHHGAHTERGHGMIVVYDKQTFTALHHHPNAESMFVMLDGACEFTVNGKKVVVGPGEATYFTANDSHELHTAPGHNGASFLEFHIPAAFTTVKEQSK